jgi:hypothetical protein
MEKILNPPQKQDNTANKPQVRLFEDVHLEIAIYAKTQKTTMQKVVNEACRLYLASKGASA